MSIRALWPWLVVGALIASASANVVLFGQLSAQSRGLSPSTNGDPGVTPWFHLAPGSSDRCPTLEQLGLTEEQRDQIRRCSLTGLDLRASLAADIRNNSTELEDLLSKDTIDSLRVLELADRISELRSRQYKAWIGSILVVREVLTPDQLRLLNN